MTDDTDSDDAGPKGMTDEELLTILTDERRRSIGFDHDSELTADREKSLNYIKGVMDDVPSMPNRSKAVSTDVSDAIETVLPDLVEIFVGGDDVVTFIPRGPEDDEAARQETDYLNYVVFQQNGGFVTFYSLFKDALQVRTGIAKYWWEEKEPETERMDDLPEAQAAVIANDPASVVTEATPGEEPGTWDIAVQTKAKGRLRIEAVPPEDFTVAADTVALADTTYAAARFRPRAQELIAQGIDRDLVDQLPAYGTPSKDDAPMHARDTAGEANVTGGGGGKHDLRQVETVEHFIRLLDGDKLQMWRVVTGGGETVLLEKEKVSRIQFSAITPYIVPHRFYGLSVSDLLMEIQKIKTALTRAYLDANYFALNQRNEVAMDGANEFTIPDLLRNEPGVPVRVKSKGTITAISAGGPGFNQLDALEFFSTVAEQRTGIVRNAQGLNPDTLHDTAKGALALMSAAQKRTRLIARIFAETGIKDLFLGVHALLRERAGEGGMAERKRLRGKWVDIDPSTWGNRADMQIEVGSGTKDQMLAQARQELEVIQGVVLQQGGLDGPLVTAPNVYNLLSKLFELGGCKDPDAYITNPTPKPGAPPPQPKPNPEMMKMQAQMQADQMKAQGQAQVEQMKAAAKMQLDAQAAEHKLQLQAQTNAQTLELAQQKHAQEFALKQQEAALTADLKQREQVFEMQLATRKQSVDESAKISGAQFGGTNP